jgi:hypothetical protein
MEVFSAHVCLDTRAMEHFAKILMNAAKAYITVIQMQIVLTQLELSHAIAILVTAVMG